MRIQNILQALKIQGIQKKDRLAQSSEAKRPIKDSVEISKAGRVLQQNTKEFQIAKAALEKLPPVREEVVQQVNQKIKEGTYSRNEFIHQLSEKLLEDPVLVKSSSQSTLTNEVRESLQTAPSIRADLVAQAQSRIQNNFYQKPEITADIAEKLLQEFGIHS